MKILIQNSDNRVMYADESLTLTDALRGNGWIDHSFNSTNSSIAIAELPEHWIGGVWSYTNEVWAVADQDAYDYYIQKITEDKARKIVEAKAAKSLQINIWRAEANQTYFTHQGKRIACDALSRSDIDAVAGNISLTGTFPIGFPGAWKAMDNTYIILPNVAAFKDMYASMTLQGTINFGQSQDLKTALAAATTLEQINNITWS